MNFSTSQIWNNSLALRYPIDKIKKIGNMYFFENDNILKCQHFFDFNISESELKELEHEINNQKQIRINYLNDSSLSNTLKLWAKKNNFSYQIVDEWKAPQLNLNDDIRKYLEENQHSQIRRNYKLYDKNKSNYIFYNSLTIDVLTLWNYVLEIDYNSWKKEEQSDMKSLDREDLQYFPFLLSNREISSLIVVCDLNNKTLAYSLMFKDNNNCWYAVKWGASNIGRKMYAGFFCLFYHLEYLYSLNKSLFLDFWGRRNKTYDDLKNDDIIRRHILISRKEE